jgi:hypothetical protein
MLVHGSDHVTLDELPVKERSPNDSSKKSKVDQVVVGARHCCKGKKGQTNA